MKVSRHRSFLSSAPYGIVTNVWGSAQSLSSLICHSLFFRLGKGPGSHQGSRYWCLRQFLAVPWTHPHVLSLLTASPPAPGSAVVLPKVAREVQKEEKGRREFQARICQQYQISERSSNVSAKKFPLCSPISKLFATTHTGYHQAQVSMKVIFILTNIIQVFVLVMVFCYGSLS